MKLIRLHVENFGCLHEVEETFTDGLNWRIAPNGYGKSTLAVFIKAMLYGLPATTKRSLLENERKRYTPWQGGAFGGSLDIEVGGQCYRIERLFGAKEAEDTLTVLSMESGEPADVFWQREPGMGILGVDEAAFERSTYLSQRPESSFRNGTESIHTKLNRLLDAADDMGNYDSAMEALEERRRYYQHLNGGGGVIPEHREQLFALEEQIKRGQKARDTARALRALADRADAEIAGIQKQLVQCDRRLEEWHLAREKQLLVRQLASRDEEIRHCGEELRQRYREVGGALPTQETIGQLRTFAEAERAAEREKATLTLSPAETTELSSLQEEFPAGPLTEEQTNDLRTAAVAWQRAELVADTCRMASFEEKQGKESRRTNGYPSGAIGKKEIGVLVLTVLSLAGIGCGWLWPPVGIAGAVALALSVAAWLWLLVIRRQRRQKQESESAVTQEKEKNAALACDQAREAFTAIWRTRTSRPVPETGKGMAQVEALIGRSERLQRLLAEEEELTSRRRETDKKLDAIRADLRKIQQNYPTAPEDPAVAEGWLTERRQSLLEGIKTWERMQEQRRLLYESNQMGSPEFQRLVSLADTISQETLLSEREGLAKRRQQLETEQARQLQEISRLEQESAPLADWENEAIVLREQMEREQNNLATIVGAQKYLKMAREQLSRRYLKTMQEHFASYLAELTGEDYSFTMDGEFRVKLRLMGAGRDPDAMSVGWRELIGFCARISLVDAMYEGEEPFLILDDPFANLDDEKEAAARRLLAALAKRYQILYLSCRAPR